MAITEIWIPETVIVLFLALPLLRPFIKILTPLDGLGWLPFIAMIITIGIFPAYGFRPECLLILIYAFVYSVSNMVRPKDSFLDRGIPLSVCLFIALGLVAVPMFIFHPKVYEHSADLDSFKILTVSNRNTRPEGTYHTQYYFRLYGSVQSDNPLIFIIPPDAGSAKSIELICAQLHTRGFTVLTYTSKNEAPFSIRKNDWKQSGAAAQLLRYWLVIGRKANIASVNAKGQELESEKREEIEFLLSRLPGVLGDEAPILLAAYGQAGSALAYLAGENGFESRYHNVLGAIAIESRLWSSYLPEQRAIPEPPVDDNLNYGSKIRRYWMIAAAWLNSKRPLRIVRSGPLPGDGRSDHGVPILYLLSGRSLNTRNPYQAVFDTLRSDSGPVALAIIQEAGPLDFQDYPLTHPLYSFLMPGQKSANQPADPISDTTSIIGNFASYLMDNVSRETLKPNAIPRHPIHGSLYIESKGLPGFRLQ